MRHAVFLSFTLLFFFSSAQAEKRKIEYTKSYSSNHVTVRDLSTNTSIKIIKTTKERYKFQHCLEDYLAQQSCKDLAPGKDFSLKELQSLITQAQTSSKYKNMKTETSTKLVRTAASLLVGGFFGSDKASSIDYPEGFKFTQYTTEFSNLLNNGVITSNSSSNENSGSSQGKFSLAGGVCNSPQTCSNYSSPNLLYENTHPISTRHAPASYNAKGAK